MVRKRSHFWWILWMAHVKRASQCGIIMLFVVTLTKFLFKTFNLCQFKEYLGLHVLVCGKRSKLDYSNSAGASNCQTRVDTLSYLLHFMFLTWQDPSNISDLEHLNNAPDTRKEDVNHRLAQRKIQLLSAHILPTLHRVSGMCDVSEIVKVSFFFYWKTRTDNPNQCDESRIKSYFTVFCGNSP